MSRTFIEWLVDQQYTTGPVGDLARDFLVPCGHLTPTNAEELRVELDRHGAVWGAYDALEVAEGAWRRSEAPW